MPCDGPDCQACHLVQLGDNILDFLVTISVGIGAIMFAVAGFRMVFSAGDVSQVTAARSMMTNVVIGFVILLAAWLIVDTIMKTFVGNKLGYPWHSVQCVAETGQDVLINDPSSPANVVGTGELSSHANAVSFLSASGITVKEGASLEGVQSFVLDRAVALNQACNCNITVTEGTGGQHAQGTYSHGNGYKLDLRTHDNPELLNYVKQNATFVRNSEYGQVYQSGNSVYLIERDHLDVQFRP